MLSQKNIISDSEKIKIDILRDALKDASDTVRFLDRKIAFLVSYNAIFLGVLGSFYIKEDITDIGLWEAPLVVLSILWVFLVGWTMELVSPVQNPNDVFDTEIDKQFATNMFFILTKKAETHHLNDLLSTFDKEIMSEDSIKKLLLKEIVKVSFIRDKKLKKIQLSVRASALLTVLSIYTFMAYIYFCS